MTRPHGCGGASKSSIIEEIHAEQRLSMPISAESVSKTAALADRVPVADIATAQNAKVRVFDHRVEGEA
jgi:hypothetical protein